MGDYLQLSCALGADLYRFTLMGGHQILNFPLYCLNCSILSKNQEKSGLVLISSIIFIAEPSEIWPGGCQISKIWDFPLNFIHYESTSYTAKSNLTSLLQTYLILWLFVLRIQFTGVLGLTFTLNPLTLAMK